MTQVRDGDGDRAAVANPLACLPQSSPGVHQVLQHVSEHDQVERLTAQVVEPGVLDSSAVHRVVPVPCRLSGYRVTFQAYECGEPLGSQVRGSAPLPAADVEHACPRQQEVEELVVHDGPVRICHAAQAIAAGR